jgi:hypothetical protein
MSTANHDHPRDVGGGHLDWGTIRDSVDMAAVATALLGPAAGRSGRRLLWPCPFHREHGPALQVDPAGRRWKCGPCDLGGDAAALVMKLRGVGFPEAVRIIAALAGIAAPSSPARHSRPAPGPPGTVASRSPQAPTGLGRREAERLVADAAERIWRIEGAAALVYLMRRGLTVATIRAAGLGWADKIRMPAQDGGTWPLSGVVIPWFEGDRLTRVKVRRLGLVRGARDVEVFFDSPGVYPSTAAIRPGAPLVIAGDELDCLLLAQELEGLAAVVALGSSASRPRGAACPAMLRCARWYVAHEAGDDAAAGTPARAVRVPPPAPARDWAEVRAGGFNRIRYIWGGILRRPGTPWEELAARRWGPGLAIAGPGFVVDRPARERPSFDPVDDHDREERAAILEFDGGLAREAAGRAAGIIGRAAT